MLTALGTTTAGKFVQSATILLDVERPDMPTSISADPPQVLLRSAGQHAPLEIFATFPDGAVLEVTGSSYLVYASSNNGVATVDKNGVVSAVAKGSASITATYTLGTQSVHFSVFVTVPPPVLNSSPTALSFNSQNLGTSSSAQTLTLTNVSNNQSLKVGPVAAAGDFSETDNCGTSSPIVVGGMCTINVTFSPAAAGARAGTVYVADGMDIVPLGIPLSGTGVAVPSITSLSPTSGPVGTSVTITGANFGTTQGTSTVTFNGTTAAPTSWSATSIVATVPTGATTGSVVVTVGGVASNGVTFTVGNAPVAYAQGNSVDSQTSQTTFTLSFLSAQNAGDLNVVVVGWGGTALVQSVTDTRGNTYVLAVGPTTHTWPPNQPPGVLGGTQTQAIYYAKSIVSAAAAANSVTVTFNGATTSAGIKIAEYSGLSTTNPVDVSVGHAGGVTQLTTVSSGTANTSNAHDLLVGADTTDTFTNGPGAAYTSRIFTNDILEDEEVKTTGSYSATASIGTDAPPNGQVIHYVIQMVAFRAAH
jgi:hypothetical protein